MLRLVVFPSFRLEFAIVARQKLYKKSLDTKLFSAEAPRACPSKVAPLLRTWDLTSNLHANLVPEHDFQLSFACGFSFVSVVCRLDFLRHLLSLVMIGHVIESRGDSINVQRLQICFPSKNKL